jgi:hypothetical protein
VAHLLQLDASARISGVTSRQLTALFADHWRAEHPDGIVTYRDLGGEPPCRKYPSSTAWVSSRTPPTARRIVNEGQLAHDETLLSSGLLWLPLPPLYSRYIQAYWRHDRRQLVVWRHTAGRAKGQFLATVPDDDRPAQLEQPVARQQEQFKERFAQQGRKLSA